jgi:hypothetical protein
LARLRISTRSQDGCPQPLAKMIEIGKRHHSPRYCQTRCARIGGSKTQLYSSLTNYNLVSEGAKTIGGINGYELVGTFTQGAANIKNKQDFLVQNGKAYVITSTALQSNYDTYQPAFDESVQTFTVTAPAFPWLIIIAIVVIVGGTAVGLTIFLVRRKRRVTVPPAIPPNYPPSQPSSTP